MQGDISGRLPRKTKRMEKLRRTIMAPKEDEVSTTQEIANRHKLDKAARDLE